MVMASKKTAWQKGRGKLGIFQPLLGDWVAMAETPMGKVRCTRSFSRFLGGNYVRLQARWEFGEKVYEEHALYGLDPDGRVAFWSFTSDGKNSHGHLVEANDVHPEAVAFEAQMPAGIARMVYWPDADGAVNWVVESKTKKGWNRFTHHRYTALSPSRA
jgi:hypothetical protein